MEFYDLNEIGNCYWGSSSNEKRYLDEIHESNAWDSLLNSQGDGAIISPELKEAFHLLWVERGRFIRERFADDKRLLCLLQTLFPPYSGDGLVLFRGENVDRFENNRLGLCWTPKVKVAQMFGSGLNACGAGGVLLKAFVPASAILAGTHPHSVYLGEHEVTVNSSSLSLIEIVERYDPSDS